MRKFSIIFFILLSTYTFAQKEYVDTLFIQANKLFANSRYSDANDKLEEIKGNFHYRHMNKKDINDVEELRIRCHLKIDSLRILEPLWDSIHFLRNTFEYIIYKTITHRDSIGSTKIDNYISDAINLINLANNCKNDDKMIVKALNYCMLAYYIDSTNSAVSSTLMKFYEDYKSKRKEDLFYKSYFLQHNNAVNHVMLFENYVLSTSDDYTIKMRNIIKDNSFTLNEKFPIHSIDIDGKNDMIFTSNNQVRKCNLSGSLQKSEIILEQRKKNENYNTAFFSKQGGNNIVTADDAKKVIIWDAIQLTQVKIFKKHSKSVNYATFSNDNRYVVSCSDDYTVRIWDWQRDEEILVFNGHKKSVLSANFSPDTNKVVTAGSDNFCYIFSIASPQKYVSIKFNGVCFSNFSPNGSWIVATSKDKTTKLFDSNGKELYTYQDIASVHYASFSKDNKYLATATGNSVRIWFTPKGVVEQINHNKKIPNLDLSEIKGLPISDNLKQNLIKSQLVLAIRLINNRIQDKIILEKTTLNKKNFDFIKDYLKKNIDKNIDKNDSEIVDIIYDQL